MRVQKKDRDSQWTLDVSTEDYRLAEQATITVSQGYGIYATASRSNIRVDGDIVSSDRPTAAIRIVGSRNHVEIAESSKIVFGGREFAIYVEGASAEVVNRGAVKGGDHGFHAEQDALFENYGKIDASKAIYFEAGAAEIFNHGKITGIDCISVLTGTIHNEKGGLISGVAHGIVVRSDDPTTIVNKGEINAGIYTIVSVNAAVTIINKGEILNDVLMSSKADRFDTRQGVFKGEVVGGEGDDLYLISRTNTHINDQGASFGDMVRSSATYTLTGGLDHLTLLGKKDIDATGNIGDNILRGNAGDNDLRGQDGKDHLYGDAGKDRLFGGTGADTFHLMKGDGADVVRDFEDGVDYLSSSYVTSIADFDDLRIRDVKGDAVIDFGGCDRLTIVGVDADQITFGDFATGAG